MSTIKNAQNRFSRRNLLQGAATTAACSLLTNCGLTANSTSNGSSGPPPSTPATSAPALTVTANVQGAIPAGFMGLSYEKLTMAYAYFHTANYNLIRLFRLLGTGVLRIGGGSVDQVAYADVADGTSAQVTPSEIAALGAFLRQTGWQCIYGVNFATSTPALAAQEAAYVVSALGPSLLGFEIGNEPDDYSSSGQYFVGNWTFNDFITRWGSFREAILEAVPNAPITGPATGGGNHITTWTLPFGQATGPSQIKLLTQHYYRAASTSPEATAAFLISPDPQLVSQLNLLNPGAVQLDIPYRLSECNSFFHGGKAGVSNSYASSLWVIDFLFNAATYNAAGVNLHGGGDQLGYTPIADHSGNVIEARPEYYGLLFFTLAGTGDLLETQFSGTSVYATAYAVRTVSGGLNVMIVNKSTLNGFTLTIETNQQIQTASQQVMTGSGLSALSGVLIQGAPVNRNGTFAPAPPVDLTVTGTQTACSIPALSAVLVAIT